MARFLVAGLPAHGLVNPVLPLVAALTARGHQVDVLLGEAFRARVEHSGATLLPWAFQLDGALTSPRVLLRRGHELFAEMTAGMIRLGPRYDAVVAAGMQPGLADVERALDRPVALHLPVFFQNERTAQHFAQICTGMPAAGRRLLDSRRVRRAVGRVAGPLMYHTRFDDPISLMSPRSRSLNMTVSSREYQPFADDFDGLYLGPTPTQRVPDPDFPLERLRAHEGPVVYGTLGTVFNTWLPFFRTLVEAFGDSDALLVLTTGSAARAAELGAVPDNVVLRPFVPQADVLDHADVCFTHGGFGTATDAVGLGVPPVLTPMGADQFFNAYRLAELGAGLVLPRSDFDVDAVRAAAQRAMGDPAVREGLATLRASFRSAGGPEAGADALEALL